MKIYTVVVEDVISQRREYVTFGENEKDAEAHVTNGLFMVESEAATIDTVSSKIISIEKVGTVDEG